MLTLPAELLPLTVEFQPLFHRAHIRFRSTIAQHSQHDCRSAQIIEARHCAIILAVLLLAAGQNFLFCSGIPQLDLAIIAPGRQPFPVE
jgi:hypothetical protein